MSPEVRAPILPLGFQTKPLAFDLAPSKDITAVSGHISPLFVAHLLAVQVHAPYGSIVVYYARIWWRDHLIQDQNPVLWTSFAVLACHGQKLFLDQRVTATMRPVVYEGWREKRGVARPVM